jgi:adenylyltransferase/sulfurtransferase
MDYPAELARYDRQMRYAHLGVEGQQWLGQARVLLCGCGALGSTLAGLLVRAGVGKLRLVDRDFLETSNLQRQTLFDEQDVADGLPKAVAAAAKLRRINSLVEIEPIVADIDSHNIGGLADGVDLILDGTDNFATRYLINDLAVRQSIPWVFGGVIGAEGQTMTIVPGDTACLRCLLPEPPPPGSTPTCDTAGILGPIVGTIASIQALEAIKILSGNRQAISRALTVIDLWDNRIRQVDVSRLRDSADCPACKQGIFPWLSGEQAGHTAVLCGRNAVQICGPPGIGLDLERMAQKLAGIGTVTRNPYLLRLAAGAYQLTLFPDGRAIIGGTADIAEARTIYARYVGT